MATRVVASATSTLQAESIKEGRPGLAAIEASRHMGRPWKMICGVEGGAEEEGGACDKGYAIGVCDRGMR